MKRTTSAAALALAALVSVDEALACSCRGVAPARVTVPSDGATGFPTDGVLRVFVTAFPAALREALTPEYRLVDARGAAVPVAAAWVGTRLDLRPRAALRPRTRYALERVYAYGPDGVLVDDGRRIGLLRDEDAGLRRVWFPEVRFETGAGPAGPRAQGRVTLVDAQSRLGLGGGDCGPGLGVAVDFALPTTALASDIVQFEVRGRGFGPMLAQTLPSEGHTTAIASDLLCTPDPVTIPYRPPLSARVVLLDATGATVAASPWRVAPGEPRMPLLPGWASSRRGERTSPELAVALRRAWSAPPVVAVTAATPAGPGRCPFGFESVARRELAPSGAHGSYDDRSTLLTDGPRAWLALSADAEDARSRLLALAPDASTRPLGAAFEGWVVSGAVLDGAPLFVASSYAAPEAQRVTLRALSREGEPRWSTPLPGSGRSLHVAVGGGRALVVWKDERDALAPRLQWALFNAQTGAAVGAPRATEHALDLNGAPVAAWAGDRFLVAWPAPSRRAQGRALVQVAALSAEGTLGAPRALDVASDGPPDLITAGDGAALVAAHDGVVRWALLDRAGAITRGPVAVSEGAGDRDNRKPRVTVRDGLFAVTWESNLSDSVWVAAVDGTGVASAALRMPTSRHASTGVVAPGADGSFLAAYTVDHQRPWVNVLRCRSSASSGAPQRIAPARPPAP